MESTNSQITIEADLAWALVWICVVIFLGALFWGMINPHMESMRDTSGDITNSTSGESEAAQTGWNRIMIAWRYWPLWFGFGLLFYGYRRAVDESRKHP